MLLFCFSVLCCYVFFCDEYKDYINGVVLFSSGEPANCFQVCASTRYGFDRKRQLECDNYKCFKLILSYNDNFDEARVVVNGKNEVATTESSVMSECIKRDKVEFVRLLLNGYCKKYNIKFDNDFIGLEDNDNALMQMMITPDRHEMVKLLLDHNVFDINHHSNVFGGILQYVLRRYHGSFPKCFQMQSDVIDYLNMLFEHINNSRNSGNSNVLKLNPMIVDRNKQTVFGALITDPDRYGFEVFQYLIEIGVSKAGWKIKDILTGYHRKHNQTLLHIAVQYSAIKHVKYLLNFDCIDVNAAGGVNNDSVLNVCIKSRCGYHDVKYKGGSNFEIFQLLLKQNGIDPHLKNKFGFDAFDMCDRAVKSHYIKYLNQYVNAQK